MSIFSSNVFFSTDLQLSNTKTKGTKVGGDKDVKANVPPVIFLQRPMISEIKATTTALSKTRREVRMSSHWLIRTPETNMKKNKHVDSNHENPSSREPIRVRACRQIGEGQSLCPQATLYTSPYHSIFSI